MHTPLKCGSFGARKLSLLCNGLGVSRSLSDEALQVFRLLSASWSEKPLGRAPAWQTDITDDGTPFEFSVAFDGGTPKLRMLVEAQEAPMTLTSSWAAGQRLNQRLSQMPNVDMERFNRVSELFAPVEGVSARYALWHAAVLAADQPTMHKVYLNPQVRGPQPAMGLVIEALRRLEMRAAADYVSARTASPIGGQCLYFSLDLSKDPNARVKIYLAHAGARAEDIENALAGTKDHVAGDGQQWILQLLRSSGPFQHRPILTCLSFMASGTAPSATLHVPIRDYIVNDSDSIDRACGLLNGTDGGSLRAAVNAFALRPLASGRGLITYVSLRRTRHGLNVTTYLAPEAFSITSPRSPASLPPPGAGSTSHAQRMGSTPPGS
jgi:DMATS type aromatic prenyltransferase